MISKHKKAQFFNQRNLFSNLNSFAELENRILSLSPTEYGDAFEVFAEAYFKTQTIHQVQEIWPGTEVPEYIRHILGLSPIDMGIDGIFKTTTSEYHAYQVKYKSNRLSLSWPELSTFMGLSDKAHKRILFTNSNDISSVLNTRLDFYSVNNGENH